MVEKSFRINEEGIAAIDGYFTDLQVSQFRDEMPNLNERLSKEFVEESTVQTIGHRLDLTSNFFPYVQGVENSGLQ